MPSRDGSVLVLVGAAGARICAHNMFPLSGSPVPA